MLSIVEPTGARLDITPEAMACAPSVATDELCDPESATDGLCHTADFEWCTCVPEPEPMPEPEPPCMPGGMAGAGGGADGGAADGQAADGGAPEAGGGDGGLDATGILPDASILDATVDVTVDALAGEAGAAEGGASDAGASEGGASEAGASEGGASDAGMSETAKRKGTWACKSFAPGSKVIATFDRLLDTTPFTPGGSDDLATATAKMDVTPAPKTSTDYTPNGSTGGLIFPLFGEIPGPHLTVAPDPSWPTANTITVSLAKDDKIRAKDKKTPFVSSGGIVDGIVTFKTTAFSASVSVPPNQFPPEEPMDGGADAAADAATSDASDAAASDASDAGTDACVPPPPPPPEPDTALADMTPAKIDFNAAVDPVEIIKHVTVTADGQPFTDVDVTADAFSVTITPKTKWTASTTFVIAVDGMAVDVFKDPIDMAAEGTFTTGAK